MKNYTADMNRFKLAAPPMWWRRQLHEFDDSLVVLPSRVHPYHILAQRRPLRLPSLPSKLREDAHIIAPDEAMLRSYGLVNPLNLLSETGAWNWASSDLRPHLAARAVWRHGGAAKVADAIDQRDADEAAARRKWRHDDLLTPVIRAGARAWQYRTGARIHNAGPVSAHD